MRAFRGLTIAALLVLDVGAAGAQASRGFKDSWFWGVKSGVHLYQVVEGSIATTTTAGVSTYTTTFASQRPVSLMGGVDWMITRSNGGLYVSFDHTFFSHTILINDSVSILAETPRPVALKGLRRLSIAGMLFPLQTYRMHPYLGFGFALAHIAYAEPQTAPYLAAGTMWLNATQENLALSTVRLNRSVATPLVIAGSQLRLPLASAFGQVTVVPTSDNFFLFTGSGFRTTFEAGLRYNFGTSIDRKY